jgi:hypothetical protein
MESIFQDLSSSIITEITWKMMVESGGWYEVLAYSIHI